VSKEHRTICYSNTLLTNPHRPVRLPFISKSPHLDIEHEALVAMARNGLILSSIPLGIMVVLLV
jgi:hypothetical protein